MARKTRDYISNRSRTYSGGTQVELGLYLDVLQPKDILV